MRRLFLAGVTGLLCLFLCACANSGGRSVAIEVPDDFEIVFGEGGGFTGRWTGHTVNPDRTIASWEGMVVEENLHAAGELSEDEWTSLWQKLTDMQFFENRVRETGNMTRLLRVTANGESHEVSWARSGLPDGKPSPLDELFVYCQGLVSPNAKP